jgi:hypothetical protein
VTCQLSRGPGARGQQIPVRERASGQQVAPEVPARSPPPSRRAARAPGARARSALTGCWSRRRAPRAPKPRKGWAAAGARTASTAGRGPGEFWGAGRACGGFRHLASQGAAEHRFLGGTRCDSQPKPGEEKGDRLSDWPWGGVRRAKEAGSHGAGPPKVAVKGRPTRLRTSCLTLSSLAVLSIPANSSPTSDSSPGGGGVGRVAAQCGGLGLRQRSQGLTGAPER